MADDAAIVNVLTLLSKNFTELNQNVKDSSDKQEALSQQLADSLKSILKVQDDQLKLNEKTAEEAKQRQTGIDNEKAQAEAKKETDKILKDIRDGQESLPLVGKYIKAFNEGKDKEESVGLGLNNIATSFNNFAASQKQKANTQTGLRSKITGGVGKVAGGLGSVIGKIAKHFPKLLKFLGPLGIAAQELLKVFDLLQGAIGFLISGTIAMFGTAIFASKEAIKDIIKWFEALPQKIFKFFSEDLPLLFEAGIVKLKEIFTNIYNYLQEKIFQPLADYLYEAWEGVMAYWKEFKAAFNEKISAIADSIYETWEGVKIWYKEIKQSFNEWLEGFADGLYEAWEGIIAYKDELMASIRNMITNVKNAAVGMFTNIINFIKEKIDAVLNIGGRAIDAVKGWFGFGGGDEETIREEAKKELTPEDFPSGVVNRNAPPNVIIEFNDEAMKLYNNTIEKNRQQTEKMTESVDLLIETISSKELGTTVINNTAPAPTQSYSSGGRLRK